jgi:hypothetical protein
MKRGKGDMLLFSGWRGGRTELALPAAPGDGSWRAAGTRLHKAFHAQWTCPTWPISPLAKSDSWDLLPFNARAKRGLSRLVLRLVEPILAPRHQAGIKHHAPPTPTPTTIPSRSSRGWRAPHSASQSAAASQGARPPRWQTPQNDPLTRPRRNESSDAMAPHRRSLTIAPTGAGHCRGGATGQHANRSP